MINSKRSKDAIECKSLKNILWVGIACSCNLFN
jgi:hypothetical protein